MPLLDVMEDAIQYSHTKAFESRFLSGMAPPNQGIPNAVITRVRFDDERFDGLNEFDAAVNYFFTPTVTGYYLLHTQIYWLLLPINTTFVTWIRQLPATVLSQHTDIASAVTDFVNRCTTIVYLTAGQQIEVIVRHNGGPGINISSGWAFTYFCGHRLS